MTLGARNPILAGLRVVELSAFVAAPLCGATLAALGADVIRVDPPGGGIDIGRWPLLNGHSLYWAGLNQGKRSVTIDTRTDAGRRQVVKLIAAPGDGGGIVLTNLPVSDWNSYAELSKARRDLIMVVITGRRDGGAAVDYTVNAEIGFPLITGPANHDGPVNHVLPAWDAMTGYLAATAIVAAERYRRLTGEGQLVELSLTDVALAVSGHLGYLAEAQLIAEPRSRYGNYVYGTFGRDFMTRDGSRLIVVALTQRHWASLAKATGLSQAFSDLAARLGLDFGKEGDRWQAREDISELLNAWTSMHSLVETKLAFDEAGVLWAPYQTFKELVSDHSGTGVAGSLLQEVIHPAIGVYLAPSSPVRFGATSPLPANVSPSLGQDTEDIVREFALDE